MDVKILDSWLRDYLKTDAKPDEIARALSLTSASIEKIVAFKDADVVYHIEVTTNRPDMASVVGLAREAAAVLPRFEIAAQFLPYIPVSPTTSKSSHVQLFIQNDDKLVRRICAVILDVSLAESPQFIIDRLEASGTRSINNIVDITNYVMHEIGHPTHAFDYDRLSTKKLLIRPSIKGEKIITLDKKTHTLQGGDIIADNGSGEIVDLLGVMGTDNSVVTDATKRIVFFIDNNDPRRIRKTSMSLAIRTEAAGLNEKDVDPELAMETLVRGIQLYQKYAKATIISDIYDIYPQKAKKKTIQVATAKINRVVGIDIPVQQSIRILHTLGFTAEQSSESITVTVPSWRNNDIAIAEDIIEEVARVFGYHNIPSELPPFTLAAPYHQENNVFYWEDRAKAALKYWGFSETYTYSLIAKNLLSKADIPALMLENPLDSDHVYLRTSLLPSLQQVVHDNRSREDIKIFEIANVYKKQPDGLPEEIMTCAGIWQSPSTSFYSVKGVIEQLAADFGIATLSFKDTGTTTVGSDIYLQETYIGSIMVHSMAMISFEFDFEKFISSATVKKTYIPVAKFPPIYEDLALILDQSVKTGDIISFIKKQNSVIAAVSLLDQYENSRTFHIMYLDRQANLTGNDVANIRSKLLQALQEKYSATVKV